MKITNIDVFDFAKCLNYEDCAPICIRSAIDIALWDIQGKYFHVPACQIKKFDNSLLKKVMENCSKRSSPSLF